MRNNNILLFIFLVITVININLYSQKFTINLYGGHSIASTDWNINNISGDSIQKIQDVNGGYGKGYCLGGRLGFNFHKHIGANVDFSYYNAQEMHITWEDYYQFISNNYTYNANGFRIIPSIQFFLSLEKTFNPYINIGFIAAKVSVNRKSDEYEHTGGVEGGYVNRNIERQYSGKFSFGFNAMLGCNINISRNFAFFIELSSNNFSFCPGTSTNTQYIENGEDVLNEKDPYDIYTEYVDEYTYDYNDENYENYPRKSTKIYMPFSNIEIHGGIKLSFFNIE